MGFRGVQGVLGLAFRVYFGARGHSRTQTISPQALEVAFMRGGVGGGGGGAAARL